MENETIKKLKTFIEALTHSGSRTLDEDLLKEVKKICKSSQENISHAYILLLEQLKKKNSQIRLAAFQICKELFKRSGLFRENLVKDLNLIFELTADIDSSKKLPPPKSFAESLKFLAISTLKEWVKEFGETYKKLKLAYNYLEKCKQVDFVNLQVGNSAEQIVENEQQRHINAVNEEKLRKVLEEFKSNKSEIEMTVTSLSNCLSLLLPPVEDFFIPEHNLQEIQTFISNSNSNEAGSSMTDNTQEDEESNDIAEAHHLNSENKLREFGVPLDYNLTVQVNVEENLKVAKSEENSSIIQNAEDCIRLISNRFLPMVKKWIKICCKYSNGNTGQIKQIIDLKEKLENVVKKYNSIVFDVTSGFQSERESSDDDFEEVTKEGYEENVDFSEIELKVLKTKFDVGNSRIEPQAGQTSVKDVEPIASASEPGPSGEGKSTSKEMDRKQRLLAIAPKLPYDIDLYHWEDEKLSTPSILSTKIYVDKFWGCAGSEDIREIPNPDGVAALRTRVIEYSGTFQPVKWACRAPLPNGKLCPRKDRFKCPFHGKIVARSETGVIQNHDDSKTSVQAAKECASSVPEFQDPEFLNDLQAATGLDLKIPDKKGKKRKSDKKNLTHKKMRTSTTALKVIESKKLPGLIDVVRKMNSPYTRLSKIVFKKSSLRRVSLVLNKLDRNKFLDKYGDQFCYL